MKLYIAALPGSQEQAARLSQTLTRLGYDVQAVFDLADLVVILHPPTQQSFAFTTEGEPRYE